MSKKLLLSLIGPPGSGKGSYGRHLAKTLDCSLIGMSDVLREMRPDLDLSSGKLVDDSVVEHSLKHFLSRPSHDSSKGYLLDGYPRTVGQLQGNISIDAVILLAVPDFVCESKLLGRRWCPKCDGNFNINGVDQDGWCQPPLLPTTPQCSEDSCGWETRRDDNAEVVRSRLKTYHDHADPIVNHFEQSDRILKLKPYNGFDDLPNILETAREFVRRI